MSSEENRNYKEHCIISEVGALECLWKSQESKINALSDDVEDLCRIRYVHNGVWLQTDGAGGYQLCTDEQVQFLGLELEK